MVKLFYCPSCERAYRFHIKKRLVCPECREVYETIDVPRSRYFLYQFPFIIVGFILVCYGAITILANQERFSEPIGVFILGVSLLLFGLALQFLDNSKMEARGTKIGIEQFTGKNEKDRIPTEKFKPSLNINVNKKSSKFEQIKLDQITQKEDGSVALSQLFTKPNKANRIVKGPKQKELDMNKQVKITQLSSIIKTKETKKKARKIRKAI